MSRMFSVILGAVAVSLSFGAAQLASGSDLHGVQAQPAAAPEVTVNRDTKADRADVSATSPRTKTISVRVDGLSDTSILVRVPVADATRKETRNVPTIAKAPTANRRTVACEPVVSVLTEIAKQLQPGRCIT